MILIGAQRAAKGQAEALDALSALRVRGLDVVLDLVGDGNPDFEAELVNRARRHGISDRVRWLPFQPDPFPLLDAADVVLTCSRGEGLGRGTIEGMKMAKPVIGAESGATPELIRHNWNGLLYPPGDVASLARCVEQLYRDRESAREMGRRGRDFALAAFNLSSMGVTLEAVLHDCIVAPRAPSMRPP
jgi:glycosyltransferase involved in cell wall biosynthesis